MEISRKNWMEIYKGCCHAMIPHQDIPSNALAVFGRYVRYQYFLKTRSSYCCGYTPMRRCLDSVLNLDDDSNRCWVLEERRKRIYQKTVRWLFRKSIAKVDEFISPVLINTVEAHGILLDARWTWKSRRRKTITHYPVFKESEDCGKVLSLLW